MFIEPVIVGSAIRKSKWLPEAVQFVRAHQEMLRHKPLAMFTVCITLAMSNSEQYRSTVAAGIFPSGDHRDWTAIQSWADSLNYFCSFVRRVTSLIKPEGFD